MKLPSPLRHKEAQARPNARFAAACWNPGETAGLIQVAERYGGGVDVLAELLGYAVRGEGSVLQDRRNSVFPYRLGGAADCCLYCVLHLLSFRRYK